MSYFYTEPFHKRKAQKYQKVCNFGYNQNIFGCSEDYLLQNVWKVSDGWSGGLLPGGQPVNKFWKCVQTSCLLLKIFKPVAFCWKFSNQLPFVKLSEKKGTLGYVLHFENIHLKCLNIKTKMATTLRGLCYYSFLSSKNFPSHFSFFPRRGSGDKMHVACLLLYWLHALCPVNTPNAPNTWPNRYSLLLQMPQILDQINIRKYSR